MASHVAGQECPAYRVNSPLKSICKSPGSFVKLANYTWLRKVVGKFKRDTASLHLNIVYPYFARISTQKSPQKRSCQNPDPARVWSSESQIMQSGICPACGQSLFNGEELQVHHKKPVKEGGTDSGKRESFHPARKLVLLPQRGEIVGKVRFLLTWQVSFCKISTIGAY